MTSKMRMSGSLLLSMGLALMCAPAWGQSAPSLPRVKAADGTVMRTQPVQCVNNDGNEVPCGGGSAASGGSTSDATAANQVSQISAANLTNTRLGDISGPAAGTVNQRLGLINGTLGSPFQQGGTIGNTAFGISGLLPAFAATPTVNLGTLGGSATAARQDTMTAAITGLGTPLQDGSPVTVQPMRSSGSTSTGGSLSSANTYQTALAASASRLGCLIQNTSTSTMRFYVGPIAAASDAAALQIAAGGSFSCRSPGGLVLTDQINLASATAGATYVVVVQ